MNTNNVTMVSLESLTPNPMNFYKSSELDKLAMAESIREHGLKVPITVMPDPDKPDRYIIISGHLRALGCQLAGLKEVSVIVEEYETEEDEMDALLLGNEYRTKTKREIATEMSWRKKIWSKKQGERSDLYSREGEVLKSTRERLAGRYKMSEANVDKYEAILVKRPSLYSPIDAGEMSIDGGFQLLNYLDAQDLTDLEDREMMPAVVERISPHLIKRVNDNKMPIEAAFYSVVKSISRLKRPKTRKEGAEGNSELKPAEKAAKPATPPKVAKSKSPEDSLPTHRCETPECVCYGQLVQIVPEKESNESEPAK
jgi:ParB-like chromosome segregation protein Spo0J